MSAFINELVKKTNELCQMNKRTLTNIERELSRVKSLELKTNGKITLGEGTAVSENPYDYTNCLKLKIKVHSNILLKKLIAINFLSRWYTSF